MPREATPELKNAIVRGAIAEGVLFAAGMFLYFQTNEIFWLVGCCVAGALIFLFFLFQGGAFSGGNDR